MKKIITYAVNIETGMVISRMGSEVAIPVLQYDKMLPENNFTPQYKLEKMDVISLVPCWNYYHWTRKIPPSVKALHRQFWGMEG